jgi:hypothetical protein
LLDEDVPPATDLWMLATLVAWENRLKRARSTGVRKPKTSLLASPS